MALLHVHVRLHGADGWVEGRYSDGPIVRGGLITRFHSFTTRALALARAGL